MKSTTLRCLMIAILAGALLSVGCAKKPTPEETAAVEQPADTSMAAAPAAPAPAPAPVVEQQAPSTPDIQAADLQRIHFAFDKFALSPAARDTLAANAVLLQTSPEANISIEGYCDERGSDEYNLALGERRAKAAKDYLISLGMPAERLQTISYGEEKPLDPASNEDAWAKNRRAEFKIQD